MASFNANSKAQTPRRVQVGSKGTIPFGLNAPLNPPGSRKANPDGHIADGVQLINLTRDPGVGAGGGGGNGTDTANDGGVSANDGAANGTDTANGW
jgi:hypothetical protein